MIKHKKGVSDIVVTVITIVIAIAAIGLVWYVINGILKGNLGGADLQAKCLGVDVEIKKANCSQTAPNPPVCNVEIERKSTGSFTGDVGGVVLIYSDAYGKKTSPMYKDLAAGSLPILGTKTLVADVTSGLGVTPNKVELTVYFKDTGGNNQICSQIESTFSFT